MDALHSVWHLSMVRRGNLRLLFQPARGFCRLQNRYRDLAQCSYPNADLVTYVLCALLRTEELVTLHPIL